MPSAPTNLTDSTPKQYGAPAPGSTLHAASSPLPSPLSALLFQPSPIHGIGGFARTEIASGIPVIEYLGEKIDPAESLRRCEKKNEFIFALGTGQHIDGNVEWNPARWINHSCEPNCEAQLDGERIWLVATRAINAGEELTFNYGFDLEDYRDYVCHCGSPRCIGYIVAEEF